MMDTVNVYQQAVLITSEYLGPAAERFINRQLIYHLGKEPHDFTHQDVPELAKWVKVSIAVLTEDDDLVKEFTKRIMSLAKGAK